jgi:hypothetical protein
MKKFLTRISIALLLAIAGLLSTQISRLYLNQYVLFDDNANTLAMYARWEVTSWVFAGLSLITLAWSIISTRKD